MKFKKSAIPEPALGADYSNEVDQVVPDQSMSLEEILDRFIRGETLPVGHDVQTLESEYSDDSPFNIDMEKLANYDFVDKEVFLEKLRTLQADYKAQEAAKVKAEAEKKRLEYEKLDQKRIRIAARKLAKEQQNPKS